MKLGIIIGSTREGRISHHFAQAVADSANKMDEVAAEVMDLRDYDLPIFNEAISPKYNPDRRVSGGVRQWLDGLSEQDAYVVVSPEYNRSISGALKNALDYIAHEVDNKPFALISHGSFNGGFALAELRVVVPELGGVTIPGMIGMPYGSFDGEGNFTGDADNFGERITGLLSELKKYSDALFGMRS